MLKLPDGADRGYKHALGFADSQRELRLGNLVGHRQKQERWVCGRSRRTNIKLRIGEEASHQIIGVQHSPSAWASRPS